LRKRAARVRSREARRNLKRRDFTVALQPILDNLGSPVPKIAILRNTPALLPSLIAPKSGSPKSSPPTKRRRVGEEIPLENVPSPIKQGSFLKKTVLSPQKQFFVGPTPTPKSGFQFLFESENKNGKATGGEQLVKST